MNDTRLPIATRREFIRNATFASGALVTAGKSMQADQAGARRPNILMICADQFRSDFVGALGENPYTRTPHLDAMARRGIMFRNCTASNPLCSPSRASFLTSRYATETGVWKLGLELDHTLPTIATEFRKNGYTASFIGKWHVSANKNERGERQTGWIPPGPSRGGFDDLWEGANVLELVSHPNHGSYWNDAGQDIGFQNEYRVDFLTDRAVGFLEQKHEKPWLLFLSQLEPHHQNDVDQFVAPARYMETFETPYVPPDLLGLPGNWQTSLPGIQGHFKSHLPGYYGCVQAIDDCVGRIFDTLKKTGQFENTIVLFFSDHGCTFRTRMGEYKRSPHDSSIRVPFLISGPGYDQAQVVEEIVTLLDLTPTLLDAAGIQPPASMRGRPVRSLMHSSEARANWDSSAYIQISDSMCGRSLRTKDWSYSVYDPAIKGDSQPHSTQYEEFALYSLEGDPAQHTNLIGRPGYSRVCETLRAELQRRIVAAGEPAATIEPARFFA